MLKLAPKPSPICVEFLLILSVIFFAASSGPIWAQDGPADGLISSDEFPVRWVVVHHETVVVEDFVVSQMEPVLEPELVQDNKESIEPLGNENLEDSDPLEEELEEALNFNSNNELAYGLLVASQYHKDDYSNAWQTVARARKQKITIAEATLKRLASANPEPDSR